MADARELSGEDPVDLAVAAYLLNYARTGDELQAMCDGIARSLRPGGRFVTVNTNPALDFPSAPATAGTGLRPRPSVTGEGHRSGGRFTSRTDPSR